MQVSGDVTHVCLMLCKERAIVAAPTEQTEKIKGSLESQYIFFYSLTSVMGMAGI